MRHSRRWCEVCEAGHATRKDGTLLPHGYTVEGGRRVGLCEGSNRPHGLAPSEKAFLDSRTAKTLGSYAEDDPEAHFRDMNCGTCSVCGEVFPLDENRNLVRHEYPDAPVYGLNHPRIHRDDHCLGTYYPPLEVSPKGAKECADALEVYIWELSEELEGWKKDGLSEVFSERDRKYLTVEDEEFESACEELLRRRESELLLLKRTVERYRAIVENWKLGCSGL